MSFKLFVGDEWRWRTFHPFVHNVTTCNIDKVRSWFLAYYIFALLNSWTIYRQTANTSSTINMCSNICAQNDIINIVAAQRAALQSKLTKKFSSCCRSHYGLRFSSWGNRRVRKIPADELFTHLPSGSLRCCEFIVLRVHGSYTQLQVCELWENNL